MLQESTNCAIKPRSPSKNTLPTLPKPTFIKAILGVKDPLSQSFGHKNLKKWGIALGFFLLLNPAISAANPFHEELENLLETHKRILATEAVVHSLAEGLQISEKALWPEVSATTLQGYESRNNAEGTANTGIAISEFDLTITQPIDFWRSKGSAIDIARLQYAQGKLGLEQTIQSILLEAVTATIGLRTAFLVESYARTSVANIKNQAQLEDAKVAKGAGLSTDVLQAKIQLAGAEARLSLSKGALRQAINRYRSVFGYEPPSSSDIPILDVPLYKLPRTKKECVELALKNNFQIQTLKSGEQLAKAGIKQNVATTFRPDLNLVLDSKWKSNVSGIVGDTTEWIAKLEMKYNFNVGGSAINSYRASKQNYLAASNQVKDAKTLVEEQARNTFEQLRVAQENAGFLENQANIAGEFLALAREERQLGRRSLIDVLSGETAEINALSDAEAAKTQVTITAYTLLFILGKLDINSVKVKPIIVE
ncbi:MAG: TolC family protein [Pseudomonadota bacterium]|nr:TolC family protein [Pseudomonadota bacterium]